jgi:hypothetical protein
MIPLLGSLESFDLSSLIRFLGQSRKTGWLRVADRRTTGEIAFEDGSIVAASFGDASGLEALDAMVRSLHAGRFTFTEGAIVGERTVDLTIDAPEAPVAGPASPPTGREQVRPPPPAAHSPTPTPRERHGSGRRISPALLWLAAIAVTVAAVLALLLLSFLLDGNDAIPGLTQPRWPDRPAAMAIA